jgi:hypothetical protein
LDIPTIVASFTLIQVAPDESKQNERDQRRVVEFVIFIPIGFFAGDDQIPY